VSANIRAQQKYEAAQTIIREKSVSQTQLKQRVASLSILATESEKEVDKVREEYMKEVCT
jgi:hypothetical protein